MKSDEAVDKGSSSIAEGATPPVSLSRETMGVTVGTTLVPTVIITAASSGILPSLSVVGQETSEDSRPSRPQPEQPEFRTGFVTSAVTLTPTTVTITSTIVTCSGGDATQKSRSPSDASRSPRAPSTIVPRPLQEKETPTFPTPPGVSVSLPLNVTAGETALSYVPSVPFEADVGPRPLSLRKPLLQSPMPSQFVSSTRIRFQSPIEVSRDRAPLRGVGMFFGLPSPRTYPFRPMVRSPSSVPGPSISSPATSGAQGLLFSAGPPPLMSVMPEAQTRSFSIPTGGTTSPLMGTVTRTHSWPSPSMTRGLRPPLFTVQPSSSNNSHTVPIRGTFQPPRGRASRQSQTLRISKWVNPIPPDPDDGTY